MTSTLVPSTDDGGFEFPSWSKHVPLEDYLVECPIGATTLGTFFTQVVEHVRRELRSEPDELYEGLAVRRWQAFQRYRLRDFMCLAYNAARLAYWNQSLSDALRRVGRSTFSNFASTMAGRTILFALGETLEGVFELTPKAYAVSIPFASVTSYRVGVRHWRFELRDVHCFADSYHYGVVEGAVLAFSFEPSMRVRRLSRRCDVDLDVRWRSRASGD